MPGRVLLADNTASVLESFEKLLAREGYEVVAAQSVAEAEEALRREHLHAAILDIRMENENDPNDISGVLLARNPEFSAIPKIMLTGYPSYDYVRQVLASGEQGKAAAVDFCAKDDGPKALLAAVARTFANHVRINWTLAIEADPVEGAGLMGLCEMLYPGLAGGSLEPRAQELADLLRKLFYEHERLRLEQLLWRQEGQICLRILARHPQGATDTCLLVCSRRDLSDSARKAQDTLAPTTLQGLMPAGRAETVRLGAELYDLPDGDAESVQPLGALLDHCGLQDGRNALKHLLGVVLPAWHRRGDRTEEACVLPELYMARSGLGAAGKTRAEADAGVDAALALASGLSAVALARDPGGLSLRFPGGDTLPCPDPVAALFEAAPIQGTMAVCKISPGRVTAQNVLVDGDNRTWLTDFAGAGRAPHWWDYVQLEAAIRFDHCPLPDLPELEFFESCLTAPGSLNAILQTGDVHANLKNNATLIGELRQEASKEVGNDLRPYYAGLLAWTVGALACYQADALYTRRERMRAAHLLVAAGLLARKLAALANGTAEPPTPAGSPGALRLDEDGVRVWIDNARAAPLSGQRLALFRSLYAKPGSVVSRETLVADVFGEVFEAGDPSQETRLTSLVRLLRNELRAHGARKNAIETVRGQGYRLNT